MKKKKKKKRSFFFLHDREKKKKKKRPITFSQIRKKKKKKKTIVFTLWKKRKKKESNNKKRCQILNTISHHTLYGWGVPSANILAGDVEYRVYLSVGMRSRIKLFPPNPLFRLCFLYPNGKWMRNNFFWVGA